MFYMTKSRELDHEFMDLFCIRSLDEVQRKDADVNIRRYGDM